MCKPLVDEYLIYTPKRVWSYCDPSGDCTITEEEIINRYYNDWKEKISCPDCKEKYTHAQCVLEFIANNWADLA